MIIVLTSDDLAYDFKGNKKKPFLKDFPAIEGILMGPDDVAIYRYRNSDFDETLILRGPLEMESQTKAKGRDITIARKAERMLRNASRTIAE